MVRDALAELGMESVVKNRGSCAVHVYVKIRRGPTQKEVWRFAKALAKSLAPRHPELLTAEYRVAATGERGFSGGDPSAPSRWAGAAARRGGGRLR